MTKTWQTVFISSWFLLAYHSDISAHVTSGSVVSEDVAVVSGSDAERRMVAQTISESEDLLQFSSAGHVMGFSPGRMQLIGLGHALIEEFEGTEGIAPVKDANGQISYSNLWPGVTLTYEAGSGGIAESIFYLEAEADVQDIRLSYNHVATITPDGSLSFSSGTGEGRFTMTPPRAWQVSGDGVKERVEVSYVRYDNQDVGFQVVGYDRTRPLVIDPVYQWHSFYGSADFDMGSSITVDGDQNIYVVGYSAAAWDGPGSPFGLNPRHDHSGGRDIMVLKLDRNGTYLWHTFYGSDLDDYGNSIAVDGNGNIYVTGTSQAFWKGPGGLLGMGILPKHGHSGGSDITVLKLNTDGDYQWHTFHGSATADSASHIVTDNSGNIYITGTSDAPWNGPAGEVPKESYTGSLDIVLLKLDSSGIYQYHTFFGSSDVDGGYSLAIDDSGNIYIAGESYDSWNGPMGQSPLHGIASYDIVVIKLNNSGDYLWHTFYGSPFSDQGTGLTLDSSGNVYVVGFSKGQWDGPQSEQPLNAYSGSYDTVVLKLSHSGEYQWHTFYGSSGWDKGFEIVPDQRGNLFIVGEADSNWNGPGGILPAHPFTDPLNNGYDMMILKLSRSGHYLYHAFYGSDADDMGSGIVTDRNNNVIVTGKSDAPWSGPNGTAPKVTHGGGADIVVLKLAHRFPWVLFRPAIDRGARD